ncbi:hypothetical protein EPI10_006880 [Gossypium australe]|uniref:Uncharacterized protein n=1 Tax=Gossypium australe TaxID=47621 RepID=A0A5B6WVC3_9ROSI|nr:hypothetical protein EPI10_006880 [Gossypium australe]
MGQVATELHNRPQGALSSDTKNPRNFGTEHCKVVALRSGKILKPKEVIIEDEPIKNEKRGAIQKVLGCSKATSHQHPVGGGFRANAQPCEVYEGYSIQEDKT